MTDDEKSAVQRLMYTEFPYDVLTWGPSPAIYFSDVLTDGFPYITDFVVYGDWDEYAGAARVRLNFHKGWVKLPITGSRGAWSIPTYLDLSDPEVRKVVTVISELIEILAPWPMVREVTIENWFDEGE